MNVNIFQKKKIIVKWIKYIKYFSLLFSLDLNFLYNFKLDAVFITTKHLLVFLKADS